MLYCVLFNRRSRALIRETEKAKYAGVFINAVWFYAYLSCGSPTNRKYVQILEKGNHQRDESVL